MNSKELLFTKTCMHCGNNGLLVLDSNQVLAYANGEAVQTAFPDLSVGLREQIITGTHPECWDEMFGKHDEEETEESNYFEELWAESQRFEARYNSENYI